MIHRNPSPTTFTAFFLSFFWTISNFIYLENLCYFTYLILKTSNHQDIKFRQLFVGVRGGNQPLTFIFYFFCEDFSPAASLTCRKRSSSRTKHRFPFRRAGVAWSWTLLLFYILRSNQAIFFKVNICKASKP